MSSISSATNSSTNSTSSFVSSLVFNLAVFGIELVAFTILRPRFRYVYEPRSLSVLASKRQPSLSSNLFLWPWVVFWSDYKKIKEVNGMDAYFFVRFLRMMVRIFLPIWLISWVILLPTTSVSASTSSSGLDKFTFGNVPNTQSTRYAAHIILVWIFNIWIWYNIRKEMHHFVRTRQRFLISPAHSSTYQASTVLITGIPVKYLSESALIKLFSHLPGGVRKVWLNRDLKEIPDLYARRLAALSKLESAETNLLNTAVKKHNKNLKKAEKAAKKGKGDGTADTSSATGLRKNTDDPEALRTLAQELVPPGKRPTHRLKLFSWMPFALPLVGKQVDSIEWAREEIRKTTEELNEKRAVLENDIQLTTNSEAKYKERDRDIRVGKLNINVPSVPISVPLVGGGGNAAEFSDQTYPPANGAFVLFNKQIAAHMAAQALTHHDPYRMANQSKWIEVAPEDIIWDNLGMNPYERRIRTAISWALTIGLIIVWAIPVAFVGAVSNINSLASTYSWLSWLNDIPSEAVGIIQGILPSVLLAVLMMLLPIVLRLMAKFEGQPKKTAVELSLMTRFFIFEVIHGFLIVTVASGIIAALPVLVKNPTSVPSILAEKLPLASTFFLTYVLLQGLSGTAGGFLQIVNLILYYVKLFLLGSTPRSVYKLKYGAGSVAWGTLFPQTTLIVVISLTYMIISPIINGLACATFFLFYLLYKYLFLWVKEMPASGDTGGLFFPKAIQHIFVGLYIQQICLCALFFLATNANGSPSAVVEGALMVVLIVFTAFFHNTINNSYGPLIEYLPLSLADRSYGHEERAAAIAAAKAEAAETAKEDPTAKEADYVEPASKGEPSYPPRSSSRASATAAAAASGNGTPEKRNEEIDGERGGAPADDLSQGGSRSASPAPDPLARADEEDEEMTDFRHPAAIEPQRIVWLPRDPLGLIEEAEKGCKENGIEWSTEGAVMDEKGHVQVNNAPPEEEREARYTMERIRKSVESRGGKRKGSDWDAYDEPESPDVGTSSNVKDKQM